MADLYCLMRDAELERAEWRPYEPASFPRRLGWTLAIVASALVRIA